MEKLLYDMLYLVTCGIHGEIPDEERVEEMDLEKLHLICRYHLLESMTGSVLKYAGVELPVEWRQTISKAVRKMILFDAEREKLFEFMEQNSIWHMPLKGIVLKEMYPAIGMRQMSDNDILVDEKYVSEIRQFMIEQGYQCDSFGRGNHDVYKKNPVYNFEIHRTLYGSGQHNGWDEYYRGIKDCLEKKEGREYEYCFTDEDFYIYMITHVYKHYVGRGTGIRSLLDVYIYLREKEEKLDFSYIKKECEILGVADFEKIGRGLSKKVFAKKNLVEGMEWQLSEEEKTMFECYMTLGVYGTMEHGVRKDMEQFQRETGNKSRFGYYCNRIFPTSKEYKAYYPFFYKHKIFLPVFWLGRAFCILFDKNRRKKALKEVKIIKEIRD